VNRLLGIASAHKAVAVAAVAAIAVGGGVVNAATDGATTAIVTKIVDGDTIDVDYDGKTHRVRLLNVDTPESVDPEEPVECLGPEASAWLEERLPIGIEVRLEQDQETHDGYGRELAAVFLGDDLVNAEIVRAGLGVPMAVGDNTRYLPPVQSAHAEARAAGRGLYSTTIDCTVPMQVEQVQAVATQTLEEAPAEAAALTDFDTYAAELAAALPTVRTLIRVLDGDIALFPLRAHTAGEVSGYRAQLRSVEIRLKAAASANSTAREARRVELEAEARRAAEEAARRAAEEAAARQAAEEAARRAAEEAARRAAEEAAAQQAAAAEAARSQRPSTSSKPSSGSSTTRTAAPTRSPSSTGSGGSGGYTGCRSYAPGGKTWTPIPC
jgi:micrococcal nuclease